MKTPSQMLAQVQGLSDAYAQDRDEESLAIGLLDVYTDIAQAPGLARIMNEYQDAVKMFNTLLEKVDETERYTGNDLGSRSMRYLTL